MRLNQFLDKLAMTPRRWFLDRGNRLRMENVEMDDLHCPISWVAHEMGIPKSKFGAQMAPDLGEDLGLSEETAWRIMDAADDTRQYSTLRHRLLQACGVTATCQSNDV